MQFELKQKQYNVKVSNILGITTSFAILSTDFRYHVLTQMEFHYRDEYESIRPLLIGFNGKSSWSWKSTKVTRRFVINSLFGKAILPNPSSKNKEKRW
ncbi:MAG: hypothetical protein U5M51_09340 [Emticicia sp.]|nr:hypothetical protein [Emticicia sp.]